MTAGSSQAACSPDGREGDTQLILWPIHYSLHYLGYTVLEPMIITDVRSGRVADDEERQRRLLTARLEEHASNFRSLQSRRIVSFNAREDWDEQGKLRPGAPVHSPFIRHLR